MGKVCKYIYLDEYGKPSEFYKEALATHGPEEAEALYILHMLQGSQLRFSLDAELNTKLKDGIKDLDKMNVKIKEPTEEGYHVVGVSKSMQRVSRWKDSLPKYVKEEDKLVNEFNKKKETFPDTPEGRKAKTRSWAENYLHTYLKTFGKTYHTTPEVTLAQEADLESYIDRIKKDDPKLYNKWIDHILNRWETSQKYGNTVHASIEYVLIEVQKERDKGVPLTGKQLKHFANLRITEARKRANKENDTALHGNEGIKNVLNEVLTRIEEVEKSWGLSPGQAVIRPEQRVYSEALNLAGSIDLLVVNPFNRQVKIFDIKTKTEESLQKFYKMNNEVIGGPYDNLESNPINNAAVQMSAYAAILMKNGFSISGQNEVILVNGDMFPPSDQLAKPLDKQTFVYTNVTLNKFQPITSTHDRILKYTLRDDYLEEARARAASGPLKTFNEWVGGQVSTINDNEEDYVKRRMNEIAKNADGDYYYQDLDPESSKRFSREIISPEQYEDKASLEAIFRTDYKHRHRKKERLGEDILIYFNDTTSNKREMRFRDSEQAVSEMLVGIDPSTHTLELAKDSLPSIWGDLGTGILVAREKGNPENITLFSVSAASNSYLKFETTKTRYGTKITSTTVFGNYKDDGEIENDLNLPLKYKSAAKEHDILLMELGVASMRFKKAFPNGRIGPLKVASILGVGQKSITVSSVGDEISKLQKFKELVPSEEFPKEFAELIADHKINNGDLYGSRSFDTLISILENAEFRAGSIFSGRSLEDVNDRLLQNLRARRRGVMVDDALMEDLKRLYDTLLLHRKKGEMRNQELQLVSSIILQINGFDQNSLQLVGTALSALNLIRSSTTIDDHYISRMDKIRKEYMQRLILDFRDFNTEHQRLLSAYLESKGINKHTGHGMKAAFQDLMLTSKLTAEGSFDPSNPDFWMMLKSESDPSLSKEAREYINFFNKNVKKAAMMSAEKAKSIEGIDSDTFYSEGSIPIIKADKKVQGVIGTKKFFKSLGNYFLPASRDSVKKYASDNPEAFEFHAKFSSEFTDSGQQHSDARRQKLGITQSGKSLPHSEIELNLAVVLSKMVNDGLEKKYLGTVNTINNAVNTHLVNLEILHPKINTKISREYLEMANRMIIHNQFADEKEFGKGLDKIGRAASAMIFTASYRQALIEFSTAWVQGTSSMMANTINKFLFKSKGEAIWFDAKDWAKAGKIWFGAGEFNEKAQVMVEENGMRLVDSEQLTSPEYTKHNKHRLIQSKVMYGLNTWSINNIQTHIFLAYALNRGFYDAYVKGEDGEFRYDETKDKRFYVYNTELGIGHKNPPQTAEEKQKFALWKTMRTEFKKEGMLYKDGPREGQIRVPLTTQERAGLKQYTTRLFGSMTKEALLFSDFYAITRAMSRYKRWFGQKIANYWTPRNKSESYQTREWIQETVFSPLLLGNIHIGLTEDLKAGDTKLTLSDDLAVYIGDSLKFGSSDTEYVITDIDGDIVTISPAIQSEESYDKDTVVHIKHAEGYYRTRTEEYEGILNTILNLPSILRTEGLSNFNGSMSRIQKENLSKLISDMILLFIAYYMAKFVLDNENLGFTKTPVGKTVSRAFHNAYGELNIGLTAYGMTDNVFPAIVTFGAQLDSVGKGIIATAMSDPEKAATYLTKSATTFGGVRTITELGGAVIGQNKP